MAKRAYPHERGLSAVGVRRFLARLMQNSDLFSLLQRKLGFKVGREDLEMSVN
jgi:hypothetical protein